MKKIGKMAFASFMILTMLCAACLPLPIKASADAMFYATPARQEQIYDLIMSDDSLRSELEEASVTVVKESIAPIYVIDLLDYAETGKLTAELWEGEKGKRYAAKVINEKGEYAGNLTLTVSGGEITGGVEGSHIYPNDQKTSSVYPESCSYADHAEEIKEILGANEIIPATDVKYATTIIGDFFFIDNAEYTTMIPIGEYTTDTWDSQIVFMQRLDDGQTLKDIADSYKKQNDEMENRKEENGGFVIIGESFDLPYITRECTHVDNVINIYDHLGIKKGYGFSGDGTVLVWTLIITICAAALAFVIIRQIVLKKRRRQSE